jgi:hypothetical protein
LAALTYPFITKNYLRKSFFNYYASKEARHEIGDSNGVSTCILATPYSPLNQILITGCIWLEKKIGLIIFTV